MEKLNQTSPDLVQKNIAAIAAAFPDVITEVRDEQGNLQWGVDFDLLRQELSAVLVEGDKERYQLTWPGKRQAILQANAPIDKTLRPVKADSADWDTAQNLYIEGDNLEVLKLLQESYLNKVKCIYIDPPYNTGKDFIYKDDFRQSTAEYLQDSGQVDEEGNRLFQNNESNGRFHSDWLTMMYPRLKLARNLLRDDGVIFISIDDNEVQNLRKLCDEIYGETNFVATLIWDKNRKNDAKFFSVGHEYMLVYFKNKQVMIDLEVSYRTIKEGVEEVRKEFKRLLAIYGENWVDIKSELKKMYDSWDLNDPRKPLARFSKLDAKGPYRDDGNINWPGGGGPRYEVLHPITKKPCKMPISGWRYPSFKRIQEEIDKGHVVFGLDESTVPRVRMNLFENEKEVMRSVNFSYAQTSTNEFSKIFDGLRVFDNPKHFNDIRNIIDYVSEESDSIILDFFSGSATTAHAVMQLNAEDGGNRKYIMVQLPEATTEDSEAYKAGYENICEIGKERIRRAAKKMQTETNFDIDYGFRVFRVDSSNMKDVYRNPQELNQDMFSELSDNIKDDRTGEDLLIQVMLAFGLPLSLPMQTREVAGCSVHYVAENSLVACFADQLPEELVREIAGEKPLRVVFRDSSFSSDAARINVEEIFKALSPATEIKVL